MRLLVLLAIAAGRLALVAAIAVPQPQPLPLPPARDSLPPARVPTIADNGLPGLQRAGDTRDTGDIDIALNTLPGRRIGRLGGYTREEFEERAAVAAHVLDSVAAGGRVVRVVVVSTVTSTELQTVTTTGTITPTPTPPPPSTTPSSFSSLSGNTSSSSPSSSRSCDLRYCDAGTSYCEYWGGYSSFDVSQGRPIPGETRTSIGVCSSRASPGPVDSTTTTSSSARGSSSSSSSSSSTSSSQSYSGSYHYSSRSTPGSSSSYNPLDSITCTSTIKSSVSPSSAAVLK
ncbi:hypothetical protein Sste5346_003993 [Sporothrix stenoceras]|uniref:Uncharacterized protein n=1 Tax=Sporothrix stenoceras TaxID=5173 RepID=A0ABR3ZAK1_9PEZI